MSTTMDISATLSHDGLSQEQQWFFAEHGWVLLEQVIDSGLCRAAREATENMLDRVTCGTTTDPTDRGNTRALRDAHQLEPAFYELYRIPGLLAAARQLIGHQKIRCVQSFTAMTDPDQDRHTRPDLVGDRRSWGWHRSFCPRDIIRPHPTDPELINSAMIAIGMYFVPIAPEHGMTALFDTSHRYEGGWSESHQIYDEVGDRLDFVQPAAGMGSIVMFSEATLHSPAPVLSEQRRFAHFAFLAVPWFNRNGHEPYLHAYLADDDLRELFAPCLAYDPAYD